MDETTGLGEIWDAMAASRPSQESTTAASGLSGRVRLALRSEPTAKHLPHKRRSIAEIDPALRQTIRQLVQGEERWPLFLFGAVGTGKTCAALALLDHADCYEGGRSGKGKYLTATELAELVIEAQQGRLYDGDYPAGVQTVWRGLSTAPLVVLDELGARERVSDHAYGVVKRLIDLREGLPLVAISNLDLGTLAQRYDDRIASRLAAGTVCRLEGEDRRLCEEG